MLDSDKPLVLLLGDVDSEGITSKIKSTKGQYKKKLLHSGVENWKTILDYFDNFSIEKVLVKLTPHTYRLIASDGLKDLAEDLFRRISMLPSIVFIYETLFSGIEPPISENKMAQYWNPLEEGIRLFVNELLERNNLNIIPYKKNVELIILALNFLEQTEQNLLFRFYVPSNRMWSLETDKLLQLFRDYLSKVSCLNIRLDQYRTDQGTIFEFHGDEGTHNADMSKEFDGFFKFLDLCISNPSSAETLLQDKNLSSKAIHEILERYSKEAKRLAVDLKHERENKLLGIRHRLESELADIVTSDFDWQTINALVDSAIPRLDGIGSALGTYQSSPQLNSALTVNISPQIFNRVEGVVAQEVFGSQSCDENIKEFLKCIKEYGGDRVTELASSVYELADKDAPYSGRITSRQKLKKFLLSFGDSIGDSRTSNLQAYVESQLDL